MIPRYRFGGQAEAETRRSTEPPPSTLRPKPTSPVRVQRRVIIHHVTAAKDIHPNGEVIQTRVDTFSDKAVFGGDRTTPFQLGTEWLTGLGPRTHVFGNGDPTTNLLRKHQHIRDLVASVCAQLKEGRGPRLGDDPYKLDGLEGIPKYIQDYSTLLTGGRTGNLAVTYLGSYNMSYRVAYFDRAEGVANLDIHVRNTSTIASATHPPLVGYTHFWSDHVGKPLNRFFSTGPLSLTRQDFYWTEYLDLSKPGCQ